MRTGKCACAIVRNFGLFKTLWLDFMRTKSTGFLLVSALLKSANHCTLATITADIYNPAVDILHPRTPERTLMSAVEVTPGREFMKHPG
jgi:hypothetical protein